MAAYNKFNQFVGDLGAKVHNLNADSLKILLTNTAPVAANAVKADLVEIGAGNGYAAGGIAVTVTSYAQTTGTGKLAATADDVWTASGGTIGPFRYAVLYNDTPTAPLKPLIGWWDYGASITLNAGETFTVDLDQAAGILTIT